jgi:hypothetical protein
MSTSVSVDPSTGNMVHVQEHRVLVTFLDDSIYFGLMVMVYDMSGLDTWFISMPEDMIDNPTFMQALRYGLMFGSMIELRRWLEAWGLRTDASHWFMRLTGWGM